MVSLMISLLVVSAGTRSASVLGGLQPQGSGTYFSMQFLSGFDIHVM